MVAYRSAATLIMLGAVASRMLWTAPAPPVIGILEQPPQCSTELNEGVRPVFARRGDSWISLLSPDSVRGIDLRATNFTLAFDGRSLGTLDTRDPGFRGDDWTFRRDHLLEVVPGKPLPKVTNRLHRFEGWCHAPDVRPIVAVASGHYEDPESWKPFQPALDVRNALFEQFRAVVGDAYTCRHRSSSSKQQSDTDVVFRYSARDLVIAAAYRNAQGKEIVALGLRTSLTSCDPYGFDPQYENHWFVIGSAPTHLGDGMDLLDAGDYDGDGHSELIFWTSSEDRDSYVLFYDDFARRAEFYWNYH